MHSYPEAYMMVLHSSPIFILFTYSIPVVSMFFSIIVENSMDPDQMSSSEASQSWSTLFSIHNQQNNTLKDFKNAKTEIHKVILFLICQFYWDLAAMNIKMSAKHVFRFHTKIINNFRATVYRIAIPLDSKVAIWNLSRNRKRFKVFV